MNLDINMFSHKTLILPMLLTYTTYTTTELFSSIQLI